jgi:hypothetical protein
MNQILISYVACIKQIDHEFLWPKAELKFLDLYFIMQCMIFSLSSLLLRINNKICVMVDVITSGFLTLEIAWQNHGRAE